MNNSYQKHLAFETAHRKRWLAEAVRTKRYIRGTLNAIIKERIHSRKQGQQTTDHAIRMRALAKTGGHCYLCMRKYTTNESLAALLPRHYFTHLQIDHIIPFSAFGPNHISNYLPACSRCNNRKSDQSLGMFLANSPYLRA